MIEGKGATGVAINDLVIMLGSGKDAKLYDGYFLGLKKHFIADVDLPESFYTEVENSIIECGLQGSKIICDKQYGPYFDKGGNEIAGALGAAAAILGVSVFYANYVYKIRAAQKIEKSALTYFKFLEGLNNADILTINDLDSSVERSEFYAGLNKIKAMPAGINKPETVSYALKTISKKGGVKLKGLLPSMLDKDVQVRLGKVVGDVKIMEGNVLSKIELTFPEPFYSDSALKKLDMVMAQLIIDSAKAYAVGLNLFIIKGMVPDDIETLAHKYKSHKMMIGEMPWGIGDPTLQDDVLMKIMDEGGVTLREGSRFGLDREVQVRLAEAVGDVKILKGKVAICVGYCHEATKIINSASRYWQAMVDAKYDPEGFDVSKVFSLKKTFYNDLQLIVEMPDGVGVDGEHDEAVDKIRTGGGVKLGGKPDYFELPIDEQVSLAASVGRTIIFEARHGFSFKSYALDLISAPAVAPVKVTDVICGNVQNKGAVASAGGVAGSTSLPPGVAKTVKDAEKAGEQMEKEGKKGEKP